MNDSAPIEELDRHGYKYISTLGRGGFGIVMLVQHNIDGQKYAIKKLLTSDPKEQHSILHEIKALAPLSISHVINYKTSFIEEGRLYLVMEYCPAGTLHDKIYSGKRLDYEMLVTYFSALTKSFAELHRKKIIHHDIKPSNILIDFSGNPKISDFGCVNTSIGTSIYYAPEQLDNNYAFLDPRVDIFSLGITLMECALGYHPLKKITQADRLIKLQNADFPLSGLPYWLQEIILKSCHFHPESRFQSMEEFHQALIDKDIPKILNEEIISVEKKAQKLQYLLQLKRWNQARKFVEGNSTIENNFSFLIQSGKYYLGTNQLSKAKEKFEKALKINHNASIEKEMAEVYLQLNEPAKATSILSGYINRNFYDPEAHNQLLHAYFLSSRWELGIEQARLTRTIFPKELLFQTNHVLFDLLCDYTPIEFALLKQKNPFAIYNFTNVFEKNNPVSWLKKGIPPLSSKLLFQEYKFKDIHILPNELELVIDSKTILTTEPIISFGREGYTYNTYSSFNDSNVSRRHFVIVNQKNNVWLYDLGSRGVFVDGKKVEKKYFLLGLHEIGFGSSKIMVKSDSKLLI